MVLESLETRRMMSVSAQVIAGILVVSGDAYSNQIVVFDQGNNSFVVGADGNQVGGDDHTFDGVTNAVIVAAGGGEDVVTYDDSGAYNADGEPQGSSLRLGVAISLGAGNDTALVALFHPTTKVAVDGGAGKDIITGTVTNKATLAFTGGADSDGGALDVYDGAKVSVDAGAGDDAGRGDGVSGFNFLILGGSVAYEGGAGNDVVTARAESSDSSFVLSGGAGDDQFVGLHVAGGVGYVYGGAGNDTIQVDGVDSFVKYDPQGVPKTIDGKVYVYGGAGNDTITLFSVAGLAFVYGEAGNDTLVLGDPDFEGSGELPPVTGHVTFDGGAGYDLLLTTLSQTDPHLSLLRVEKVTPAA